MGPIEDRLAALESERVTLLAHSQLIGQLCAWIAAHDPLALARFEAGLLESIGAAVIEDDPARHHSIQRALALLDAIREATSPSPPP